MREQIRDYGSRCSHDLDRGVWVGGSGIGGAWGREGTTPCEGRGEAQGATVALRGGERKSGGAIAALREGEPESRGAMAALRDVLSAHRRAGPAFLWADRAQCWAGFIPRDRAPRERRQVKTVRQRLSDVEKPVTRSEISSRRIFSNREQRNKLAGMIGAAKRRIISMVGGKDGEVARP